MPRLLLINPNRDESMERVILASARVSASKETRVDCRSILSAPAFIENYVDEVLAAPGMVELVKTEEPEYDAFIVACHSDVNMEVLRETTEKPVLGIGESSLHMAAMLGHLFTVIQTTEHSVPMKEDMVRRYGLWDKCASVRAVQDDDPTKSNIVTTARRAIEEDGAEVIVLGCGGLAGQEGEIQNEVGVPVVNGVACAVTFAEGLVRSGLTVSKRRKYRPINI